MHSWFLAMHIPDGFLSPQVALATGVLALALVLVVLRQTERYYQEKLVPLMGLSAAFIFAAQMVNFPIPGGTSGHLLGGTLVGILLGPWAGTLVMVVVFVVQAVLFQDGGVTALGANILNMGLVGTFLGYYLFRGLCLLLGRNHSWTLVLATGLASWTSVVLAAVLAALELAYSGTVALMVVLPAMLGVHALIGLGEALLTVTVIKFLGRVRPDILFGWGENSIK